MARRRRSLALVLLGLLLTAPALAQTKPFAAGAIGPAHDTRDSSSLMAVHDGRGAVTVIADQASVREVFRVLSRWFDFPTLNIEVLPDVRLPIRFERMPVSQVVQRLLRLAGLPPAPVTPRARSAPPRRSPFIMVHDGQGGVTVVGEQASTREVMARLSRWFGFPVVNSDAIPDARGTMRFERVPVAQLVDRLLRSASLNYVILTNPRTSVPSKVVAAPLSAARTDGPAPAPFAPANEVNPSMPGWPGGPANIVYPPVNPGGPMPMPMPMPMPVDPAMPMLPMDPMTAVQPNQPAPVQPAPGTAGAAPGQPGAARPGVMTPNAPAPAKPPG